MRNAYARFVLRLIRPALQLHDLKRSAMARRLRQALRMQTEAALESGDPRLTAEQFGKKAGEVMRRTLEGPLS